MHKAIHVANVPCAAVDAGYRSSTSAVCTTRAPAVLKRQSQHIVVKLRDDARYTVVSNATFTYVDPRITSFRPQRGPRAGGTDITLLGEDLDSGFAFNVSIGTVPCELRSRTSTMVVCRTGVAPSEGSDFVIINADGTQIKADDNRFQYA